MSERPMNRLHYMFLDSNTLLVFARLQHVPAQTPNLTIDGRAVDGVCGTATSAEGAYVWGVLRHGLVGEQSLPDITVKAGSDVLAGIPAGMDISQQSAHFESWFEKTDAHARGPVYGALVQLCVKERALRESTTLRALLSKMHGILSQGRFNITACYVPQPGVLYFEGSVTDGRPMGETTLLIAGQGCFEMLTTRFVQLSDHEFAFISIMPEALNAPLLAASAISYFCDGKPAPAMMQTYPDADALRFLHFLNEKPAHQKQNLRELICRSLIDFTKDEQRTRAGDLIHKMQLFVQMPSVHCMQENDPFNINFETVIPVGSKGVFAAGWIRDAYGLLESITVHSALGISFPMHEHMFRTPRPDVQEHFQNTAYGKFHDDMGFVAWAPLPEEAAAAIEGLAQLHSVRFEVTLKGGITYMIQPQQVFRDVFDARDVVTKIVPSQHVTEEMLHRCMGPVASELQADCMREVTVSQVYDYGVPLKQKPKYSLSIPLYKRLEFVRVQLACMANDPDIKQTELIYVLDSPWQEAEVRDLLREHAYLYELNVKLVVMKRNSGYAAASNAGADHATGDYIVLLNSDVFPAEKGWLSAMVATLKANPKAGIVAPKLLYDDGSLQHAGMFFEKTTLPDWLNLHYYKGYPAVYPAASKSRRVPAVTGACLMMLKKVWDEVGALSTSYIVGDFEDSDLCLKASEKGYESWYCADTALYHPERQSVPLNDSYTESLAWRYNAYLHTTRWDDMIRKLMKTCGER